MSTNQAFVEPTRGGGMVGTPVRVSPLAQPGDADWCEHVYQQAGEDAARVPWALERSCPPLVSWLNAEAPGRVRPGARAAVVGCGLGDDVVELLDRGYDAVGFDVCPTAVSWARRRFPVHAESFIVADLFELPSRLLRRHDVVIEANTIQSVPCLRRADAAAAIASLCCPRGTVVCVCRGRDDTQPLEAFKGPPWPLSADELVALFERVGMHPVREPDDFEDDQTPPVRWIRAAFVHR